MSKIICSQCEGSYAESNFYVSKSLINRTTGRIPICKTCFEKRYEELLVKYEGDCKSAFKHLLLNFDIYFDEEIFNDCLLNKQSLLKTYMTKINSLNKTKDKTSKDNTVMDNEADEDIADELVFKWGENWTRKQYESLERREQMYLDNYPSDTLQEKEIIHSLCEYKELENSARAMGDDKTVERYSNLISNKMGQLDVIPSKMKNYAESVDNLIGMMAVTIEKEEPVPDKFPEFDDVDGILKMLIKYFIKPMRKALSITKTDYAYGDLDTDDGDDCEY